ncbi:VWFA and cache domain-containing protein 1, partial [Biomphalaria glabrata]
WRSNAQYFPSLKWQYFISMEGLHNEYPANTFSNLCDHSFPGPKDCHNIHDVRH